MTPEPTITTADLNAHLASTEFAQSGQERTERVGLEAEFFLLHADSEGDANAQLRVEPREETSDHRPLLIEFLDRVGASEGWRRSDVTSPVAPDWELPSGARLTLEPGGQVECSTIPHESAEKALDEIDCFESLLHTYAAAEGLTLEARGYLDSAEEHLPDLIVRKPRYLLMDQHFAPIGRYGRLMMRATCSTQVNLDFGSGETALRRWRLANHLAPLLATLFTTSEATYAGEHHANFRREIWRRTDPSRTGIPSGMTGADPIGAYLNFALDATVIFLDDLRAGPRAPSIPTTFRAWLTSEVAAKLGGYPDLDDWEQHLTTLFPEVRPRGFIEIRSLDAMPSARRRAAVTVLCESLYNEARTEDLLGLFEGKRRVASDPFALRRSLMGILEERRDA